MSNIRFRLAVILAVNLILPSNAMSDSSNSPTDHLTLIDFQKVEKLDDWVIVNDGVMGGLSQSKIFLSDNNTALFQGIVSLENNGGFSSTRTTPGNYGLDGYNGILLLVKGDGKKYQFRIRTDDQFDGVSYRYHFETEVDQWITVKVPFGECVPVFRGRVLDDVETISPKQIQQIGFLISDKQKGPFRLEIKWIKAYK